MIRVKAFCLVLCVSAMQAQYGSAPNNYYPDKYNGSTFTGAVTRAQGDEVTLTYSNKGKTDTFTGRLEAPCSIPTRNGQPMTASDLAEGAVITAFYNRETVKTNGQKEKVNIILALSVDVWNGHAIPENTKKIYSCSKNPQLRFRAWAN